MSDLKRVPSLALLLAFVAMMAVKESTAAPSAITTNSDGTINCDGLECPLGARCAVSGDIVNGRSFMTRRCLNSEGAVVAESSYEAASPGIISGRQSSTAILTNTIRRNSNRTTVYSNRRTVYP